MVKNETTVLNLVFKEFLQTSIPPPISVLYAKGYHDFPLKNFCLTVPEKFVEEPFCVSEKFWFRKMLGIREGTGITIFRQNCFASQYRIISYRNPSVFHKVSGFEKFHEEEGGWRENHDFVSEIFLSHSVEKCRRERDPLMFTNFGYRKILC